MEFYFRKFWILGLIILVLGSIVVASNIGDKLNISHKATVKKLVANNMDINIHTNKRYTGKLDTQNAKSYSITALPKHGKLTLNKNSGRFTYTPNRNFVGRDSFKYKAINGKNSKIATVKITVTKKAPVVYDTSFDVVHDRTYKSVFNATDSDGDKLTYNIIFQPINGKITLNSDRTYSYTPNKGFTGIDSFTYIASDGIGKSKIATVKITVTNNPPVAQDISFQVRWSGAAGCYVGNGVFNATDSDGDKLTYRIIDKVQGDFDIIIFKEGSFTTLPNPGPLVFHYVANDGISDSNIATARS